MNGTERYRNVHRRGVEEGFEAATEILVDFLESGGQIALQPFSRTLVVKYPEGLVGHVYSIKALGQHHNLVRMLREPAE